MPVWNRESILELLTREVARSASSGTNLTVVLARIETSLATAEPQVAAALSSSLRPYDYIGSYGRSQFLILAPEIQAANARAFGEKLRQTVADSPLETTLGVAVAASTDFQDRNQSDVLRQMEDILDRIHASGGNKVDVLGGMVSSAAKHLNSKRKFNLSWLLGGAAVLCVVALILLTPSWTCAPNLVSDLLDSGELPPPLPPDCLLATEKTSDAVFDALEKQREAADLELQGTVTCKIAHPSKNRSGIGREQQWLGSLYADGRLQYRRHVLIAASQDVPGGRLFTVEQCLTPWWKYIMQSKQYCRIQNLPWE